MHKLRSERKEGSIKFKLVADQFSDQERVSILCFIIKFPQEKFLIRLKNRVVKDAITTFLLPIFLQIPSNDPTVMLNCSNFQKSNPQKHSNRISMISDFGLFSQT